MISGHPRSSLVGLANLVRTSTSGPTNGPFEKPTYHQVRNDTIVPFLVSAQAEDLFQQPCAMICEYIVGTVPSDIHHDRKCCIVLA